MFLQRRLVAIEYTFDRGSRPKTLTDALIASGLPPAAVALNRSHSYFRAEYTENPAFRNPLRCCGLVFHLISIPLETLEEIDVIFANINLHFREWPVKHKKRGYARALQDSRCTGYVLVLRALQARLSNFE